MRLCKITVYNYHNEHGAPYKVTVNALCVGGDEGVFAVFRMPNHPDWIGTANGDDGHWRLSSVKCEAWLDEMITALSAVKDIPKEE